MKNGKGAVWHAYLWGVCEPGDFSTSDSPVDHRPGRGLIDDFGYWG